MVARKKTIYIIILITSNVTKFFLIHVAYSQLKIKSQLIGKKKLGSGTFSVGWSVAATAN